MWVKEKTKQEIEEKYAEMGEYVKMDYLSSCLKNHLDFDTRKFVLVKLMGLYEEKKMFLDSGRMMMSAAEINTTFQNKINDFVKAAELFIKGGDYFIAESSMNKALALASDIQRGEIKNSVKEFYKTQARLLMDKDKRNNAMNVYKNLLEFDLDDEERSEITDKLLSLYERLGKMMEYDRLKKG